MTGPADILAVLITSDSPPVSTLTKTMIASTLGVLDEVAPQLIVALPPEYGVGGAASITTLGPGTVETEHGLYLNTNYRLSKIATQTIEIWLKHKAIAFELPDSNNHSWIMVYVIDIA